MTCYHKIDLERAFYENQDRCGFFVQPVCLPGVDFACVPLKIVTDEQEYLDDGTLDAVGMARSLRTYKGKTSTSCPNVADWLAAYEGAEQIFVATITGTLSGSYNAALLAAEEYKETHPEARIFVLDSLSAGPELRLLAERLRDLVRIGMEFDEICEAILLTTSTHICCFRWNRWPIWPAMAV